MIVIAGYFPPPWLLSYCEFNMVNFIFGLLKIAFWE